MTTECGEDGWGWAPTSAPTPLPPGEILQVKPDWKSRIAACVGANPGGEPYVFMPSADGNGVSAYGTDASQSAWWVVTNWKTQKPIVFGGNHTETTLKG